MNRCGFVIFGHCGVHDYDDIQDIVDIILGYGKYLESLGFQFNDFNKSGICHHIIYNKHIINEIFNLIEKHHNQTCFPNLALS